MKKLVSISISLLTLAISTANINARTAAQSVDKPFVHSKWVGVWQGQLGGLPGVVLTLGDDLGELSGTIVFTAIRNSVVSGHATHNILHPHLESNRLSFQIIGPHDGDHILDLSLDQTSDSKEQLLCPKCRAVSPIAMENIP